MLKKTDRQPGEAKIRYLDADLELLSPGDYVLCAVTGRKIPIAALRYWNFTPGNHNRRQCPEILFLGPARHSSYRRPEG